MIVGRRMGPQVFAGKLSLRLVVAHLLAAFLACGALPAAESANVRIVGSDLLGVAYSKALYEFAAEKSIRLAVAFDGSRPAVVELKSGRADLALLTLPAEEELVDEAFASMTLGYHRVVVLVRTECPLERITFAQLRGIFGTSGAMPVERWGDLGVTAEWAEQRVSALAPEVGTGIAVEFFRRVVLRDQPLRADVVRFANPAELTRRFANSAHVIALAADLPSGAAVKSVAVASESHVAATLPSADVLHRGEYPLSLPLRVVVARRALTKSRALLEYLGSEAAAEHLRRAGVVPVPAEDRAQELAKVAQR